MNKEESKKPTACYYYGEGGPYSYYDTQPIPYVYVEKDNDEDPYYINLVTGESNLPSTDTVDIYKKMFLGTYHQR